MTREEILESLTMAEVLRQYGIEINRNSMCSCPFHGKDRHPSMKVYKTGYNCFTCGANGDLFKFVQEYENCDFKTAFYKLGGNYNHQDKRASMVAQRSRERLKKEREQKELAETQFKRELSQCITICRVGAEYYEPLSDEWCFYQNALVSLLAIWQEKYEENGEVNEINVYRICREVRQSLDITPEYI